MNHLAIRVIALLAITFYNCVAKLGEFCLLFVLFFFVYQLSFFTEFKINVFFLQNCLGGNTEHSLEDIPSSIA